MTGVRPRAAAAAEAGRPPAGVPARQVRHFVTDRRRFGLSIGELVARTAAAAAAGVDVIQVREPDLPDRRLVALVRDVLARTAGTAARVLVNDRPDIAIAAGAAGVHLRGDSAPAPRVRLLVAAAAAAPSSGTSAGFLIGRSVHTLQEIDEAVAAGGCDYLLFGTVFPSAGKPEGHPVAGLEGLRLACARSPLPIIAIGGMTPAGVDAVAAAGAAGFAAVGMFTCLTPLPQVV